MRESAIDVCQLRSPSRDDTPGEGCIRLRPQIVESSAQRRQRTRIELTEQRGITTQISSKNGQEQLLI